MADLGEKYKDLLETLEAMHVEPKANTPEEFAAWMHSYLQQQVVLRKIEREHIVDNPSLKTNTKNICKKSTKTEDEETEPDLKAIIQQINTRLEKIEKSAPIYTGAPENSDAQGFLGAQGYSDTSGYTGAPGFNNPSGYSGARGRQPYRGGYRGNNRGYRGYNRGFQQDGAPTSTEDTVALQEVEIEQDRTESVGDAQSDIQEIRDDSELGSASGIDESSHELLNADETVQSDNDSDTLDDLVLTPIPPPRRSAS
ncbi:unnamed protein product [Mytilus coruscus]|uniref:Uncharacterized protein n=1 Tax=Mytilus coruscus TaxID=42192 RepID=A0A6J8DWS5_MYTCO|nr:unnamed protein product [Mytilus coruscus]